MKVKLLVGRAGPNLTQNPGDEVEVSDAVGRRLIEDHQAVPVRGEKVETATSAQAARAEATVRRRPGRPKKGA